MQLIIFGANGMLGHYLHTYLSKLYTIIPITRTEYDVMVHTFTDLEALLLNHNINSQTVVINALGTIPQASKNYTLSNQIYIRVNSIFPHILAQLCDKYNAKLIHSTTDCVFSGNEGLYLETDTHNCNTIYGETKSAGEPSNCTVIRTSIIGEELTNKRSLLEWVKSNNNQTINGYVNHFWNGITCLQYAKLIDNMIQTNNFWKGVRHIYSPTTVSKYDLVKMIVDVYNLNINIVEYKDHFCDRSIRTIYSPIDMPELIDQIKELKNYQI